MFSKKPSNFNLNVFMKAVFIMLLDVAATAGSYFLGLWFRYDFSFHEMRADHWEGFLSAIGPWCLITVAVFLVFKLYSSIWAFVSTSEVFRIIGAYLALAVIGAVIFPFDGNLMPRMSMITGYIFSFVSTVCIRFAYRLWRTALRKISHAAHASGVQNVMLIGAGDAGRALAMEFANSEHVRDHLVCVIDDNPVKINKYLCGAPIVGNRYDIPKAVTEYQIDRIIFAIPTAAPAERKAILDICSTTGFNTGKGCAGKYRFLSMRFATYS